VFNFAQVNFPSANVAPARINEMTLWQDRFKHEFATIQFRDWDVDYEDIRPGSPMTISLKGDEGSNDFHGYVHHVQPHVSPGARYTEVTFIGASYFLKQTSQKIYKNVTADQIIAKIAKRNNFAYNAEPHPRVYDQVSQAGLTDVEMMTKLAKQCGYSLRLSNSEIYFQPVTKMYDEERENAPRFALRDANDPQGSNLYSFKPLVGESLDQDGEYKAATAVSGVDKHTGQIIQLTNQKRPKATKSKYEPEFFDRFSTITVINDYDMAKNESKSADDRTKLAYRATAEVLGDPTIHPDMPVYIEGVGDTYAGYWIVLSTEHKISSESYTNQRYTTVLSLGTDSLGQAVTGSDNRLIKTPNTKKKRTIIPNVRQTNKKPKNVLKKGQSHPSKKKSIVGFGSINNRAKPKVAGKTIIASKWSSPSGNLKKVTKTSTRPQVVVKKLRSSGVL
jgi:hypothetical protein